MRRHFPFAVYQSVNHSHGNARALIASFITRARRQVPFTLFAASASANWSFFSDRRACSPPVPLPSVGYIFRARSSGSHSVCPFHMDAVTVRRRWGPTFRRKRNTPERRARHVKQIRHFKNRKFETYASADRVFIERVVSAAERRDDSMRLTSSPLCVVWIVCMCMFVCMYACLCLYIGATGAGGGWPGTGDGAPGWSDARCRKCPETTHPSRHG